MLLHKCLASGSHTCIAKLSFCIESAVRVSTLTCRSLSIRRRPSGAYRPLLQPSPQHALTHRRSTTTSHGAMGALAGPVFFLDDFAARQWDDPNYSGTRIDFDKADFVTRVHEYHAKGAGLVDGYAPFCKHVFVPNFVGARVGALAITPENAHLLRSGYSRRRPEEFAVLTRWFPAKAVEVPEAKFLDIILYSREQILKEREDMPGKGEPEALPDAPWGIISIKAQDEDYETPMSPITIMRNALGRAEGGSGVPLNRAAYDASVEYWQDHAAIVAGESPTGE